MAQLQWKEEFSVGDAVFDADHQNLISLINRLSDANSSEDDIQWVLQQLEIYVQVHFSREEMAMKEADYPSLGEHKLEHDNFTTWLGNLKSTFGSEPDSAFHLTETIAEFLNEWLTKHILHTDMQYKNKI
ncbi:MAG: hemerythrin family protein [Rhodospirillaceae bacterium]|jgi:hemerythrin|nr:hemerythrin family protein [Rhodospirillaceae bacterium]MBT4937819.1 hemerythrin family protein [Rhodospirillaceae bacterium]MBT5940353.1 hemerythrin family protein [Rhodospirillaceae bacterium]MBT7267631.1 hemerythrin family protein [Rhodospirillaceae bacterium]